MDKQQQRENFREQLKQRNESLKLPTEISDEELDKEIKLMIPRLERKIKETAAYAKLAQRSIEKLSADKDVLTNVDLPQAKTEWHKKLAEAEIKEIQAVIAEREFFLVPTKATARIAKENLEKMQNLL